MDVLAQKLADAGIPVRRLASDAGRWTGYQALLAHPDGPAPVVEAVLAEKDLGVRAAVVARLLEVLPTDRHAALLSGLSGARDPFLDRRAADIAAERAYRDDPASLTPRHVADMSLWLQRRLVEAPPSRHVAEVLTEHGTARKVRNAARAWLATSQPSF